VVTAKHVFLHGMPARGGGGKDAKLPEQYGDIGKEMSDMIAKAGKRAPPTLVAVDRATRQALWQVAPVYGHVLANDAVTMAVSDTAETGMMTMLAGGKGELIVRRFNLRNGKNLYQRTSELGFREPVLAGDRAVGLVYERLEQAGLLSGGDGGSSRAPQFLGLAAIRAR
jgi:hypothetical protein